MIPMMMMMSPNRRPKLNPRLRWNPRTTPNGLKKNSFDELDLNLLMNVDTMVKMVVPKLQNAKAKGATLKFLRDSVQGLQLKLTLQESEQLHKTCKEFLTKRKKKEQEIEQAKRKEEEEAKKKQQGGDDDAEAFFRSMGMI